MPASPLKCPYMLCFPSFSALTIDIVIIARPPPSGVMLTPSRSEPPLYQSHLIGLRYLRTGNRTVSRGRNPANVTHASAWTGSDVTHKMVWYRQRLGEWHGKISPLVQKEVVCPVDFGLSHECSYSSRAHVINVFGHGICVASV